MNPLILAVAFSRLAMPQEPVRAHVDPSCKICLNAYIENPAAPGGRELIRSECTFTLETIASLRSRQAQIAREGTYSLRNWEDWGTWYPPHRIESVEAALQPPCI
jgi:hypothetical protein